MIQPLLVKFDFNEWKFIKGIDSTKMSYDNWDVNLTVFFFIMIL